MRKLPKQKKIILNAGLIIFAILIYGSLFLQMINNQKIALGIKMGDFHIGLTSNIKAQETIENNWANFANQSITLVYKNQTWTTTLANLGYQLNFQNSFSKAHGLTNNQGYLSNVKNQWLAAFGYYRLSPSYDISSEQFSSTTAKLFENVEQLAQNATLEFNDDTDQYELVESQQGTTIDRDKIKQDLANNIAVFANNNIELNLITDTPSISNDEVVQAQEDANRIISKYPYYLIFDDRTYTIGKDLLIDWIIFESVAQEDSDNEILRFSINYNKIEAYLDQVAELIDRPAQNAQLAIEGSRATLFVPPLDGFEVKRRQTYDKFLANLLADEPIKNTYIIADVSAPQVKLFETNNIGIRALIGQGQSNYSGSPNNRRHNIATTVSLLNGQIVPPDTEFSFLASLGEVTPERGYLPELVIKDNSLIAEYGGGVCQVSTTFFRAAAYSGMEITERQNHSFPVTYYNPQGFDATVYDPRPDFKFFNNTPASVLINAYVANNRVYVDFYGSSDGREVTVAGPYITERGADGSMKAILYQEVVRDGETIIDDSFFSVYKSPDLYTVKKEEEESQEETTSE